MFYRTAIRTLNLFNREGVELPEPMKLLIKEAIIREKTCLLDKLEYLQRNSETDPTLIKKGWGALARIESYLLRLK